MSAIDSILRQYFEFQMEKSGQTGKALSDMTVACIKLHRAQSVGDLFSLYEQCYANEFPDWYFDAFWYRLYRPWLSVKGFLQDWEVGVRIGVQCYIEDLQSGCAEEHWDQRTTELISFHGGNYLPAVWNDVIRATRGKGLSFFERVTAYCICAYFDSYLISELNCASPHHGYIFQDLERADAVLDLEFAYEPLLRKFLTREMQFWNRNVALTLEKEVP